MGYGHVKKKKVVEKFMESHIMLSFHIVSSSMCAEQNFSQVIIISKKAIIS